MGIARSTYYDAPLSIRDDTAIVEAMGAMRGDNQDERAAAIWMRTGRG